MNRSTNHSGESYRRAMTLGVIVAVSAATVSGLLLQWSWVGLTAATAPDTVPVSHGFVLLIGAGAGLTSAAVSWLAVLGVLALAPRTVGASNHHLPVPRLARLWGPRAAAALLALSLSAPAAHPASPPASSAAEFSTAVTVTAALSVTNNTEPDSDTDSARQPPSGLPGWSPTTPTLPGATPSPEARPSTAFVRSEATSGVVVRRGDTLWDIAASALEPVATNAEIAAHWPEWYEANRQVIGPNPHLLLPGQILQPPPPPGAQP